MITDLPFKPEQFFTVFARYNERVWPMQAVLYVAALASVALLFSSRVGASRVISFLLAFLWTWMAIAYHVAFFSAINPAAWLFGAGFLLGSLAFGWYGVVRSDLTFQLIAGVRGIAGAALIVSALVLYPAIGYLVGHRYPSAPTFGLPCPTTIFTLGLLLFAVHPVPGWVIVVPLLWTAVGSLAAFQLGVLEDLALPVSGAVTIAVMILGPGGVRRIAMDPGGETRETG